MIARRKATSYMVRVSYMLYKTFEPLPTKLIIDITFCEFLSRFPSE